MNFKVLRMGHRSDSGPAGEWGCVLVGEENGRSTGVTVHCPTVHEHGKECAQALLGAAVIRGGQEALAPVFNEPPPEEGQPDNRVDLRITPRAWFALWHAERDAEAAKPMPASKPMPRRTVTKVVDGKSKQVQEDDPDLA